MSADSIFISSDTNSRARIEKWAKGLLFVSASISIAITVLIVLSVLFESIQFFYKVPIFDFLFGTTWSPQTALRADQAGSSGSFGAIPVFVGTLLITLVAMLVAVPLGLYSAIYLSEYASRNVRAKVKPVLEILAGIPTVVYGYFAVVTIAPVVRGSFSDIGNSLIDICKQDDQSTDCSEGIITGFLDYISNGYFIELIERLGHTIASTSSESALVAGLVMGIMIIPFILSLSDDVINSVPNSLRDASLALGATKAETVTKVVLPAAFPGIMSAVLLGISRAIGETMIVTMAAGLAANLTINPLESVTTVTVQIVTLLVGDQEFDSAKTLAAFALGLSLFVVTLVLNVIALKIVKKYKEQYD